MKRIIFATHNPGKLLEMQEFIADLNIDVVGAKDAGVFEDVVEDGKTFEANAEKKARFVVEKTGEWAFADDSGLTIDALDDKPGVHTARWAGEGVSGDDLVSHTLEQMKSVPFGNRQASFHTYLVLIGPNNEKHVFNGEIRGIIQTKPSGIARPKLPYDVIFKPDGFDENFAEMSHEQKNAISHRGIAFQKLKELLASKKD